MSMMNALAMMTAGGKAGALPPLGELLALPCAACLLELEHNRHKVPAGVTVEPRVGVTLAAGSIVCAAHVPAAFGHGPNL